MKQARLMFIPKQEDVSAYCAAALKTVKVLWQNKISLRVRAAQSVSGCQYFLGDYLPLFDGDFMLLNQKQLASAIGITDRRIRQLVADGIFTKCDNGNKYLLSACNQRYIEFKIKDALGDSVEYNKEHALLEKAKREKAEIQLAEMKSKMHRAEDVEYALSDMITRVKQKLRSIPVKVAPRLTAGGEATVIQNMLLNEVDDCLTELSEYTPRLFAHGNREDNAEDV